MTRRHGAQVMSMIETLVSLSIPFGPVPVFSCPEDYSQSRVRRERRQSATSHDSHYPTTRRESIATSAVTSAMPMPSQRPGLNRNSSTSGSVATESTLGSSYQSSHSYSQSGMYSSQSRRPSDAVLPERPSFRSRTESSSSNSSNYGNDGWFGWKYRNGGDGYYGWPDSSPQTRKP